MTCLPSDEMLPLPDRPSVDEPLQPACLPEPSRPATDSPPSTTQDAFIAVSEPLHGEPTLPDGHAIDVTPVVLPTVTTGWMQERLDVVQAELGELKALFLQQSKANDLNRIAFDRLHKEMQDYKDNFLARAQEPVYRALIALDDDIGKTLTQEREVTRDDCQHLRNELEEILARQDVEPFACEAEGFDPARQKAVRTEPTADPEKHRHVASRLRRGFKIGERILRSEYVTVFVYTPANTGEEAS